MDNLKLPLEKNGFIRRGWYSVGNVGISRLLIFMMVLSGIFYLVPGLTLASGQGYSSQQIVEMSRALRQKEKVLAAKEKLLDEKEKRLLLLQNDLIKKERDIAAMEQRAKETLDEIKAIKAEDLSRLVKVFGSMKPADSAPLVERLENVYAVEVILRLEPRRAGKILAAMKPERAAEISRLITSMSGKAKK